MLQGRWSETPKCTPELAPTKATALAPRQWMHRENANTEPQVIWYALPRQYRCKKCIVNFWNFKKWSDGSLTGVSGKNRGKKSSMLEQKKSDCDLTKETQLRKNTEISTKPRAGLWVSSTSCETSNNSSPYGGLGREDPIVIEELSVKSAFLEKPFLRYKQLKVWMFARCCLIIFSTKISQRRCWWLQFLLESNFVLKK